MKNAKPWIGHGGFSWWRLTAVFLLSSCILHPASLAGSAPLYLCLIDRLPPPNDSTLPGLDKPQRDAAFRAAVQTAATARELPPVIVIDPGAPVPAGAALVRVYLKQWSNQRRRSSFTQTEITCRFYAEVVREGRTVRRIGPCEGRADIDPTAMTAPNIRGILFQEAARRAMDDMAPALPR